MINKNKAVYNLRGVEVLNHPTLPVENTKAKFISNNGNFISIFRK